MNYRVVVKDSTGDKWHSIVSEAREGETVADIQKELDEDLAACREYHHYFFMVCPPDQVVAFNPSLIVAWYVEVYRK